ncbi:hypothetical protein BKA62DRAFT_624359, partial [Auriculariales sp. MPI-PUGE-AT-0066]
HFLTQIPHPMHRASERVAILSVGLTSMQSLPERQNSERDRRNVRTFLHSCAHR